MLWQGIRCQEKKESIEECGLHGTALGQKFSGVRSSRFSAECRLKAELQTRTNFCPRALHFSQPVEQDSADAELQTRTNFCPRALHFSQPVE